MLAIPLKALDATNTKSSKLFGRAPYVLLIAQDGKAAVLENEFKGGEELAEQLLKQGVKTVITNHIGEKAYSVLKTSGVEIIYADESASILLILDAYKAGSLKPFDASMIQEAKHRNEGECNHGKRSEHSEGECCGHEHGGEHTHGHGGGRCCEKDGGEKQREGRGRCFQKN